MRSRPLAQKLILSLTIIVVIVEGIAGYINVRVQEQQILDAMILGADQLSKSITSATWHAMLTDNRNDAYEVMNTIALKQGIDRIRIYNSEGRVMFSTAPNEADHVDKKAEACALCHTSSEPLVGVDPFARSRVIKDGNGHRQLSMITPVYNEQACSQAGCHAHPERQKVLGVLDVSFGLSSVDKEVGLMEQRAVLVTLVQIILTSLCISIFTRVFVTKPIHKLIEGTRAISEMHLGTAVTIDSSQELEQLSRSFDIMRVRLLDAVNDLNKLTSDLETQVEQRTQQLKAAHQKLIHADRLASLGQLAASVAHEINNPLSGVLNLSMLMQRILSDEGIPRERAAEFRKYLAQVIQETSRVGHIVTDLLSFSRRSKPQSTLVDLNGVIRATISLVSHTLHLGNVAIETDLQPDLSAIRCDGSQIQQVVMNLVLNGAEAIPVSKGGIVRVSTREDIGSQSVVLDVEDTGEGIPPENVEKIFDPFFTTKEEGKGVGLGLAVVYGVVHAHGGDIEVTSVVGRGTTFHVSLPLNSKPGSVGRDSGNETGLFV